MRKKPSALRSFEVMNGTSRGSMSDVISYALSASVRATSNVDVPHTSAARRAQRANELLDRHQHLAAHVAALLLAGELVFEVNARSTGFDHALHQLERVERTTKSRPRRQR